MKGILCSTKARNNEEYRKVIKRRMQLSALIGAIGLLTTALSLMAEYVWGLEISDHILGVYCGMGCGLLAGCIVLWIKQGRLLKDEEKLTQSRLENADERIEEINNKALRSALIFLLVALYAIGLIGGIFYPILTRVLAILVAFFILVYLIARKVYEKKM